MDLFLSRLRVRLSNHLPKHVMRAIRPFMTVQFAVFMLMGIINTAILVCSATVLDILHYLIVPPGSAFDIFAEGVRLTFILGYIISIITSFFLNSKYTFRRKPTFARFIRFPISYIPNFVFQYLMVFLFTALNLNSTLAYVFAAILGTPVTFAAMKFMVFQRRKRT